VHDLAHGKNRVRLLIQLRTKLHLKRVEAE
jgi:hypothetical protein